MERVELARAAGAELRARGGGAPLQVGIILGSGLGSVAGVLDEASTLDYRDLPGFPVPGIAGHGGRVTLGRASGLRVAVLQGRVHYYEQGDAQGMEVPVRALAAAGCETLLLTNAAGSVHRAIGPGTLVAIEDHINLMGANPLIGLGAGGDRFVDMTGAYDGALRTALGRAAERSQVELHTGVYACFAGPSFETPAEVRAARVLGADVVGMSIVPETILARYCGLRVAGLSVITNHAAGVSAEPLSHEQTMAAAAQAVAKVVGLVAAFLADLGPDP